MADQNEVSTALEEPSLEEDITAELTKAQAIEDAKDHTFTVIKDPGHRTSPAWNVAEIAYLTYEEVHKVFKEPWVWGASVLGPGFKDRCVTEWGFVGPEGREWAVRAVWLAKKGIDKTGKHPFILGGTGTDYDTFMNWFAGRLNRQLPVTPTDEDTALPKMRGVVDVYGSPV